MRRPPHEGQNPRPLHEKATSRSARQPAQRKRANPPASPGAPATRTVRGGVGATHTAGTPRTRRRRSAAAPPRRARPPPRPGTSGSGRAPPGTAPRRPVRAVHTNLTAGPWAGQERASCRPPPWSFPASIAVTAATVVTGCARPGRHGSQGLRTARHGVPCPHDASVARAGDSPAFAIFGATSPPSRPLVYGQAPRRTCSRCRSQLVSRFQLARFWSAKPSFPASIGGE